MWKNLIVAFLGASVGSAMLNADLRADSIPWGFSAGSTEIFNSNSPAKSSSIKFAGASGIANGNSGIIVYSLSTTSSALSASPDSFASVPFDLAFSLVDIKATGSKSATARSSDVAHFSGFFSASNVTKQSLLPGAPPWSTPPVAKVVLGGDDVGWRTYSVQLSSFTSPGQPGGSPGSIQAIVMITPADAPQDPEEAPGGNAESPPGATPEPASLMLAGIGLLPAVVFWSKRKKASE